MPRSPLPAALLACLSLALAPAAASAFRLPADLGPIAGDPANQLLSQPIEGEIYEPATHCDPHPHKGVTAALGWLARHTDGVSWGTYRCEKWGKHSASLHAEGRAIDWHPGSRRDAAKLIDELLAPDRAGNPHALARRMGVEELIWDCSYWGAGSADFGKYSVCYGRNGKRLAHVDPTAGHLNHVHIGFTWAGARGHTSFYTGGVAKR
jgi:hypothetical protein